MIVHVCLHHLNIQLAMPAEGCNSPRPFPCLSLPSARLEHLFVQILNKHFEYEASGAATLA